MTLNQEKSDQFGERLMHDLNSAAAMLMLSLGHRSGLLDILEKMPPSTSVEIANEARLNERYVREWLSALVAAEILEFEPNACTYKLPEEHAHWLTRSAPFNFASTAQFVSMLGAVEPKILNCFKEGGGVPYADFPRFHEVMAEESAMTVLPVLESHILPLIPGGREALERGARVADLGCGSGRALIQLAKAFPKSSFMGFDLCEEAVVAGRQLAGSLKNVRFEACDVSQVRESGGFDIIFTFDAIHDQANPQSVLGEIYRLLADEGTYLMQDIKASSHLENNISHPLGTFIYTISCLHCMTVSLAQNGKGLGAAWGKELAVKMLREAGFQSVEVHELEHDIQNYYYVSRK